MVSYGQVGFGLVSQGGRGGVWQALVRSVTDGRGMAVRASGGEARKGAAWRSWFGLVV